jgi:hypothetical protein
VSARAAHVAAAAVAAALALGACTGGTSPASGDCYAAPASCVAPGARHAFVVDQLRVPRTALDALELGLNVDGDAQGRVENQLGNIVSTMSTVGEIDAQALVDGWLADGTILLLLDIQARDLGAASGVGGRLLYGTDADPAPCAGEADTVCRRHLAGGASFAIDATADVSLLVPGRIDDGLFRGGPVPTRLEIRLPGFLPRPVTLDLVGVRTRSRIGADGIGEGVVGGALRVDELRAELLPVVVEMVQRDCPGAAPPACCAKDSPGEAILRLFSPGADCQLTLGELEADPVLATLLEPDVDMLDADGAYAPGADGARESISIGLGFSAVPAVIRGER